MVESLIGTHNGAFHCDEVTACFMLHQLDPFKSARIIRTRDPAVLSTCTIVVDVGDVYDPPTLRYDHHQSTFHDTLGGAFTTVRLSSAGLIYKHYGREVLQQLSGVQEEKTVDWLYSMMYRNFIEMIDANDNGVAQYKTDAPPLYSDTTSLPSRVGRLNAAWHESVPDDDVSRFHAAMEVVGEEFRSQLRGLVDNLLPAKAIVEEAYHNRKTEVASGAVLVLARSCPWKEFLYEVEKLNAEEPRVFFAVYSDGRNWRIQDVGLEGVRFGNRKGLPAAWRGKRGEELAQICGVADAIFAHNTGFIGGAASKAGVLRMAELALAEP
jgi:uncharacterized UPF0160 family protein